MHRNFTDIYDQYFDDVYRYVYFKTGNRWDTDDLVSEAFRKAFENYSARIENPKAWLFTIVRNTVTDFYRKKKDVALAESLENCEYTYGFEQSLEKQDELNCLKQSLKLLSKEEMEIVNLRYFAGLKHLDIADLLGKSEDSVKMKVSRIIKKLKDLTNRYMEE